MNIDYNNKLNIENWKSTWNMLIDAVQFIFKDIIWSTIVWDSVRQTYCTTLRCWRYILYRSHWFASPWGWIFWWCRCDVCLSLSNSMCTDGWNTHWLGQFLKLRESWKLIAVKLWLYNQPKENDINCRGMANGWIKDNSNCF